MNKELSIGEVATIHGKTVLCVQKPKRAWFLNVCEVCAFCDNDGENCPPCVDVHRTDDKDVFYPEITKGL